MNKNEIAHKVLARITAQIESNPTAGWIKPFNSGIRPYNAITRKTYNGINFLMLMGAHRLPAYMTFNQAKQGGFKVKKGAAGWPIVFYKMLPKKDKETGEISDDEFIPLMRISYVFNVEDIEGVDLSKYEPTRKDVPIIESCERLNDQIKANACEYTHVDGGRAFYNLWTDSIQIPPMSSFISAEHYYGVLWHEMAHSTGATHRLNRFTRDESPQMFGDTSYAKEELIAELTAAMLMFTAGIESVTPNHAAYIISWLRALKNDPAMLIPAASAASKAYDYLMSQESSDESDE